MAPNQFRTYVWDPVMILAQILAMQCVFYASMGAWIAGSDVVLGVPKSLDQIFLSHSVAFTTTQGRLYAGALVLNALTCALGLWYVVERTKQCLDFAVTVHCLHFLFCCFYGGAVPSTFSWWMTQVICAALTTVLAEYLCMRTELKAIPVSIGGLAPTGARSDL